MSSRRLAPRLTPRLTPGSISQVLRAALGLSFPWLLLSIPAEVAFTGPALAAGLLLFLTARIATLFEPETLRRTAAGAPIGEGIFVALAMILALVANREAGHVDIGIGGGIALVLGYLLAHFLVLPFVLARRARTLADARTRPRLRWLVYSGTFVAEEAAALTCVVLAVSTHVEARQGPWNLWDLVPIVPLLVLALLYRPLLMLEIAAHPNLSAAQSEQAAFEGLLLQVGAVLVAALTGVAPWI